MIYILPPGMKKSRIGNGLLDGIRGKCRKCRFALCQRTNAKQRRTHTTPPTTRRNNNTAATTSTDTLVHQGYCCTTLTYCQSTFELVVCVYMSAMLTPRQNRQKEHTHAYTRSETSTYRDRHTHIETDTQRHRDIHIGRRVGR